MPQLSSADHSVSPPRVSVPRDYNAGKLAGTVCTIFL